jgi:hypothetical protein
MQRIVAGPAPHLIDIVAGEERVRAWTATILSHEKHSPKVERLG